MLHNDLIKLEKLNQDDKLFYREIYTDPILMQYVCQALDNKTADNYFNIALKIMAKTPAKSLLFVIRLIGCNTKVGVTSIRWNQEEKDSAEIGVMVLKKHQRKQYAHMAKSLMIKQAFQQFNVDQLIAICEKDNIAANKANQKLGFSFDQEFFDKTDNKIKIKWVI